MLGCGVGEAQTGEKGGGDVSDSPGIVDLEKPGQISAPSPDSPAAAALGCPRAPEMRWNCEERGSRLFQNSCYPWWGGSGRGIAAGSLAQLRRRIECEGKCPCYYLTPPLYLWRGVKARG